MKIVTDISTTAMLRRARGNWDPGAIFRSPLQGAWFDPSDVTTLFQDSAATVPVAGDGDPVGRMLDKSGNGNDAVQSNAARRPKWRTDGTLSWIEFDGVDDRMETAITVLDGAPVMTSCAGLSYLPGGAAWGALRSLVDVGIYVGLSHPSITGAVSNVGGAFFLNGVPAPNDRKALREALVAPAVFEGQDIQTASLSGQKWQVFSYWNTSPPGGVAVWLCRLRRRCGARVNTTAPLDGQANGRYALTGVIVMRVAAAELSSHFGLCATVGPEWLDLLCDLRVG